jgi:ADP-ribose pyrophosphatase YjhB (NUDIX family)
MIAGGDPRAAIVFITGAAGIWVASWRGICSEYWRLKDAAMNETQERRASRLILLDSKRRVLLFRHARRNGETFWAPPGGGLDAGETFEQAAFREASEELGLKDCSIKLLWEKTAEFIYDDQSVHQRERYFLVDGNVSGLLSGVQKIHDEEGILETKWWAIADLQSIGQPVFPEYLARELEMLPT